MPNFKNIKYLHKISPKALIGGLAILAVIIAVWLVGYFSGIDENKSRSADTALQPNNSTNNAAAGQGPNLPQLPRVSEKSTTTKLPQLPQMQ